MAARLIMTASAIALFLLGGGGLFAGDEIARLLDPVPSRGAAIAVQMYGGSLLGFAVMNWMSRRNRIGGIYARPLGLGNLLLFAMAALALGKALAAGNLALWTGGICALFAALAASFGWLVFAYDPLAEQPK